ncbi:MAG: hypothetical protein ACTJLK_01945 [Anaplasma sp.]
MLVSGIVCTFVQRVAPGGYTSLLPCGRRCRLVLYKQPMYGDALLPNGIEDGTTRPVADIFRSPPEERVAHDLRSRVYAAYMLCSSMLSIVPLVPYCMSKELYKRKHFRSAAVSMEVFLFLRSILTMGLVFVKILLIMNSKYPHVLDGFFIANTDMAVLFLAAMCTLPLVIFSMGWRYYFVHEMVKSTQCGVVHALLEQSYLRDVLQGMPSLVSYNGRHGPFFINEKVTGCRGRRDNCGVIMYESYLYCTSYLTLLPTCIGLLCTYFHYKNKKTALSVTSTLGALSHVLVINVLLVFVICYSVLLNIHSDTVLGLHGDLIGISVLTGVFVSVFILIVAIIFCYYSSTKWEQNPSDSLTVPHNVARTVLKFGILTAAVCNICELFSIRERLGQEGKLYSRSQRAYDIFFYTISSLLILPACFAQLALELRTRGYEKAAAVADRMHLFSEIFLTNALLIGVLVIGMLSAFPEVASGGAYSPACMGFICAIVTSVAILIVAGAYDVSFTLEKVLGDKNKEKSWHSVLLSDCDLRRDVSNFGILNSLARGAMLFCRRASEVTRGRGAATARARTSAEPSAAGPGALSCVCGVHAGNDVCRK